MSVAALARPEIVAMKPYSSARSEAPAEGVLLNANEAPHSLLSQGRGEADWEARLNRYPDPQPQLLLHRLAALYGVRPEQVLVTRGSDEGIDLLTRVFCRAGTDAILHCPPTFGMYRIAAQAQGAAIVEVPRTAADDFRLDGERLLEGLRRDPRIKLLFLTSPNNPTGDAIDPDLLQRLLAATRDRSVVVLDEAYAEFCGAPSAAALVDQNAHLAVLRTLSKAWAAAGLRCGTVLAQPELIGLLRRIIAPYPLPSPVVALALRMLEDDMLQRQRELLLEIARNKRLLIDALANRPFVQRLIAGRANFVLVRVEAAEDLLAFCAGRGVILRGFPAEPLLRGFIRISVGSADDLATLSGALDAWQETRAKRVERSA